jgi:Tfp pilus assembly protein PilN
MKAVNLIPAELRRDTSVGGRSGGAVYGVLAVLALAVLVVCASTLANRSIAHKRTQLAETTAQADRFAAQADRMKAYTTFAALREARSSTVASIARSRFDWARAMREVARTLPADVTLTALTGTVTPDADVEGATADPLRTASAGPALVLAGCTTSQDAVARTMVDLRRIEGVERVALSSSEKADSGSESCTAGSDKRPQFSMVVFFKATTASAATAAAPAGTTPTPATSTTPATTSTTGATK